MISKFKSHWDKMFFDICETISVHSRCLSRQIGAVIVRDKTIVSTGYNGPPRGIPHCGPERRKNDPDIFTRYQSAGDLLLGDDTMCPRFRLGADAGELIHLCPAAHAEANAIFNAARLGVSVNNTTMYMNCGIPCRECLKAIINSGINTIVCTSVIWYDSLSQYLLNKSNLTMRDYEGVELKKEN